MKVLFAGDLFLGGDLLNKSCENIVYCKSFADADIRVVNLEQSISDSDYVKDKCTLYTGSNSINQLKALNVNVVNLAHNHIQDKGLEGIDETVKHLDWAGIGNFGAGFNIKEAEAPYYITEYIALLGYCEFDKPYLSQIEVAGENKPGVNPLRKEKIKKDLDLLPEGKKAVLYFHWGMEHVWLPPHADIKLAKELLEDDRVIAIIGMHSHRVQGILHHNGKKAFMGLGNFLFPNFYIKPPVQLAYPSQLEAEKVRYITRQYHRVYELTYKKWRWVNRVSAVLTLCTETNEIVQRFVLQDDNKPEINDLSGICNYLMSAWTALLSFIYRMPRPIYNALWILHAFEVKFSWRLQIYCFQLKQLGLSSCFRKALVHVGKK